MTKTVSRSLSFILISVAILMAIYPLLQPGWFDVHDPTAVVRLYTLRETLTVGQIPAQWTNLLNQGHGYPLFQYYAPLATYLSALISIFTPTLLSAIKLTHILAIITATLGMYLLTKKTGQLSATLAAITYTVLPYHALTIYVRGATAEVMAWALLPWLLYFWIRPVNSKRHFSLLTIITAAYFLSHNTVVWFILPVLIFLIFYYHVGRSRILAGLALLSSLILDSWFLLPLIFEQNYIQATTIATQTRLTDHFLTLSQLWHSPWAYGGSAPMGEIDGMSFMLGKLPLIIVLLALLKLTLTKGWTKGKMIILGFTLAFALATTNLSQFLWELFPFTHIIQFPWRLLLYASAGVAYMTSWLLPNNQSKFVPHLATVLLTLGLIYFSSPFFRPQSIQSYTDSTFLNPQIISRVAKEKIPEYLPVWMPTHPESAPRDGLTRSAVAVTGRLVNTSPAPLTVETAYMPQWRLTLNEDPVDIIPTKEGNIQTHAPIPVGEYEVNLTWQKTTVEKIGLFLSLLSLIVVIGLAL